MHGGMRPSFSVRPSPPMSRAHYESVWYRKSHPTFSDALAQVRRRLWAQERATFRGSLRQEDMVKVPRQFIERLTDAVCYAA